MLCTITGTSEIQYDSLAEELRKLYLAADIFRLGHQSQNKQNKLWKSEQSAARSFAIYDQQLGWKGEKQTKGGKQGKPAFALKSRAS